MKKPPMKTRIAYLACGLVIVAALVSIAAILGQTNSSERQPSTSQPSGSSETEDLVLIEDGNVRITYSGSGEAAGVPGAATVNFRVENLSDQEFTVYPVDSYVNDTAVLLTSGVPATVAPGKSYVYPWVLSYAAVGIESYGDLKDLETCFELMAEDGSVLEELGPFTVELTQN